MSFEDWIEQRIEEDRSHRLAVQTDGADYHHAAGWGEWTEAERDEADKWTHRLHASRVRVAELAPADRGWISSHVEGDDTCDPVVLEAALASLAVNKGGA